MLYLMIMARLIARKSIVQERQECIQTHYQLKSASKIQLNILMMLQISVFEGDFCVRNHNIVKK